MWDSVTPWRQGPPPERGYSTIPHAEQPPDNKTGWDVVPKRPQQEAVHPPTARPK